MKKKITLILVAFILLVYVGYQIYISNFTGVKTQTVKYSTLSDSIQVESFVIRDEEFIENNSNGVLAYLLDDGEKISNGGLVAEVFKSRDDANAQKEIQNIEKEIYDLNRLTCNSKENLSSPIVLDERIEELIQKMIFDTNVSNYNNLSEDKSNILYLMNERQIVTGKSTDFSSIISELKSKRDSLIDKYNSKLGSILSPASGYFVSKPDGYENVIDFANVLSIMPNDVRSILDAKKNTNINKNIIGKVIKGINWYIVCNVSSDDAFRMYKGKEVSITLPFALSDKIPATVSAINQQDRKSEAAVVLCLDYMNPSLSFLRNETIKININTYEGLLINKKSLHEDKVRNVKYDDNNNEIVEEKIVKGVYVRRGKELIFKQVIPIFSNNNYIICKQYPGDDELFNGETINILDEVVIEGANLYNGKVVG